MFLFLTTERQKERKKGEIKKNNRRKSKKVKKMEERQGKRGKGEIEEKVGNEE